MPAGRSVPLGAAVLLLAGLALALQLRRSRPRPEPPPLGIIGIELAYDTQPERAADVAFAAALDRLVTRLREGGLRIGAVLPEPRSARIQVPGLEPEQLTAALAGLPLHAQAAARPGEVEVALDEGEGLRAADVALQQTATAVRQRVLAAHPCDRCFPAVLIEGAGRNARLLVRLPWIDDITERRVRAAIAAAPALPAPVSFASEREVRPEPPPSL